MSDLISRQTAIDALEQIFDRCEEIEAHLPEGDPDRTGYKMYPDYMTVWKYLHQLPSAQPDIIRCKDCENWIPGYITDNDDFIPPKCGKYQQMVGHSSDDYCSHAERKTDG